MPKFPCSCCLHFIPAKNVLQLPNFPPSCTLEVLCCCVAIRFLGEGSFLLKSILLNAIVRFQELKSFFIEYKNSWKKIQKKTKTLLSASFIEKIIKEGFASFFFFLQVPSPLSFLLFAHYGRAFCFSNLVLYLALGSKCFCYQLLNYRQFNVQ